MSVDNSLTTFKAIANFVTCLNEVFGNSHKPLKLYAHLLSKTTLMHEKPIQKHLQAISNFCISNREAIASKDIQQLSQSTIVYSHRVYINLQVIMLEADSETLPMIWQHLLILSALTDPTGKAKEILKEMINDNNTNKSEANFLNDIIGKVESHVNPDSSPMEAVTSILQSGVFTDLIGGMGTGIQDGSLDLSKLMGTVQKMVGTISEPQNGGNNPSEKNENATPETPSATPPVDPMSLISNMMANMGNNANPNAPPGMPDLGALMGNMGNNANPNAPPGMPDLGALMANMANMGNNANPNAPPGMPDLGALMGMIGPMMGPILSSLNQPNTMPNTMPNLPTNETVVDKVQQAETLNSNLPLIEELPNESPADSIVEID